MATTISFLNNTTIAFNTMKKVFIIGALLAASAVQHVINAQTIKGALHFSTGTVAPLSVTLPGNFEAPAGNVTFGSGGWGRLGQRFLLGGSGFGSTNRNTSSPAGTVSTNWGMGFADVGYIFTEKKQWLHYVFAGIGGGGLDLRYNNNTEQPLRLSDNLTVAPGQRAQISTGGLAWQAGISINRVFFGENPRFLGPKIGLEAGVFHFPLVGRWRNNTDDAALTGIGRPGMQGAFIRLTVGGFSR